MNISMLQDVLTELVSVGVERVVISPETIMIDDEEFIVSRVSGCSENADVVVFDLLDECLFDSVLAIRNVKALLSRLSLFDMEKASIGVDKSSDDSTIVNMTIKEGRKKTKYRCGDPKVVRVPQKIPEFEADGNPISMTPEFVSEVIQATSSLSQTGDRSKQTISLQCKGDEFKLVVYDGENDSFECVFPVEGVTDFDKTSYAVGAFNRVLKHSSANAVNGKVDLFVTKEGLCKFMNPFLVINVAEIIIE